MSTHDHTPAPAVSEGLPETTNKGAYLGFQGVGQYHTNALTDAAGETRNRPTTGQHYEPFFEVDLWYEVENPPQAEKGKGKWMVPSSYRGPDAREVAPQTAHGQYECFWFDIDEGNHSIEKVWQTAEAIFGTCRRYAYYTSSATEDKKKSRLIVPFCGPLSAFEYSVHTYTYLDEFEKQGIWCDSASARPSQLCYLPTEGPLSAQNKCEAKEDLFYSASRFDLETTRARYREALLAKPKADRETDRELLVDGKMSLAVAFKLQNPLEQVLAEYGYIQKGRRWVSPYSESGTPGVTVFASPHGNWDVCYSHHDNDPLKGEAVDALEIKLHFMTEGKK